MPLTGQFRFRGSLTGKVVLQLEEEVEAKWPLSRQAPVRRRWREARAADLAAPEMRSVLDLGQRPRFLPYNYYAQPTLVTEGE